MNEQHENTAKNMQQNEEALYEIVAAEMAVRKIKKGLWAKAYAQCEGDQNRAKALYVKLRVQALKDEAAHNVRQERPSATQTEDDGQSRTSLGGDTHPWRRFFARIVDNGTTYYALGFVLGFVLAVVWGVNLSASIPFWALMALMALMQLFVEAGLISLFGTTPAKWLFGIRVAHPDGSLLTFQEAIKRSFLVFVQGLGFAIPFIAPFTQLFAYRRLTKTGTTRWDAATNAVVHHEKWGLLQTIGCSCAAFFAIGLIGLSMNPSYWQRDAQGDAEVQLALGVMYFVGDGVPQDYAQARSWFEKAAAQGHAMAQFNLGVMYRDGKGVRQDKRVAKEWYGKACDAGYQPGCNAYRQLNAAGF